MFCPASPRPHAAVRRAPGLLLATLLALIVGAGAARALEVAPGETISDLEAEGCASASGGPTGECLLGCASRCVLADDQAKAFLDVTNYGVGKKFVQTTAFTEFTVAAGDRAGAGVDATVAYDVSWKGGWTVSGVFTGWNDGLARVSLVLSDRTSGSTVRSITLHEMKVDGFIGIDLLDVGFGLDEGATDNTFNVRLTRGHEYRLSLQLRVEAKGAANASVILDYDALDGGARWTDLSVAIAPDLAEEVERIKERLTRVETRLDSLEHRIVALEGHTHTYLTGRGEGHNNTEAETSEPRLVDGGEVSGEELRRLPLPEAGRVPLPVPSVFLRGTPNPLQAGTRIRFALPEPQAARIDLFTVDGRLSRTLLDEFRGAGEHEVPFDVGGLPPGIYYYRLTAGRFAETRKLTLLR